MPSAVSHIESFSRPCFSEFVLLKKTYNLLFASINYNVIKASVFVNYSVSLRISLHLYINFYCIVYLYLRRDSKLSSVQVILVQPMDIPK